MDMAHILQNKFYSGTDRKQQKNYIAKSDLEAISVIPTDAKNMFSSCRSDLDPNKRIYFKNSPSKLLI